MGGAKVVLEKINVTGITPDQMKHIKTVAGRNGLSLAATVRLIISADMMEEAMK